MALLDTQRVYAAAKSKKFIKDIDKDADMETELMRILTGKRDGNET